MKFKKIIALCLTALLAFSALCACNREVSESSAESSALTPTPAPETESLKIVLPGEAPAKLSEGIAAVNEQLRKDGIYTELSLSFYDESVYADKLRLLSSSGVDFDLFFMSHEELTEYVNEGIASDISSEVGANSEFYKLFPKELWDTASSGGKTMAVPVYLRENNGGDFGFFVNQTLLDKSEQSLAAGSIDELRDSLSALKGESDLSCLVADPDAQSKWLYGLSGNFPFAADDELGLVYIDEKGKAQSFCRSDSFRQLADFAQNLNGAGLFAEDISSQGDISEKLSSGNFLTISGSMKDIGKLDFGSTNLSYVNLNPVNYISGYDNDYLAVSSTSDNAKGAIEFLNWLYSSQEHFDLFHFGTEGSDYSLNDGGRVVSESGAYSINTSLTGYLPLMRYGELVPQAYIDAISAKADETPVSVTAGFTFDSSSMEETVRRLKIAVKTYVNPIKFGFTDYDDGIDAATEGLNMAGLNEYIEEYQKQYDAYLKGGNSEAEESSAPAQTASAEEESSASEEANE